MRPYLLLPYTGTHMRASPSPACARGNVALFSRVRLTYRCVSSRLGPSGWASQTPSSMTSLRVPSICRDRAMSSSVRAGPVQSCPRATTACALSTGRSEANTPTATAVCWLLLALIYYMAAQAPGSGTHDRDQERDPLLTCRNSFRHTSILSEGAGILSD